VRRAPVRRILSKPPKRPWSSSLWGRRHRRPRCDVGSYAGPASFVRFSCLNRPPVIEPSCSRWGLPAPASPRSAVRSYRTISPLPLRCRNGGLFLWHFPSSRPDRTLSCTLPDGARTFLDACAPRRPSALRASDAIRKHAARQVASGLLCDAMPAWSSSAATREHRSFRSSMPSKDVRRRRNDRR
jgi:hypothetical protein